MAITINGGDAYFRDWHSELSKTTGLLSKVAHDIDVIHWLASGVWPSIGL